MRKVIGIAVTALVLMSSGCFRAGVQKSPSFESTDPDATAPNVVVSKDDKLPKSFPDDVSFVDGAKIVYSVDSGGAGQTVFGHTDKKALEALKEVERGLVAGGWFVDTCTVNEGENGKVYVLTATRDDRLVAYTFTEKSIDNDSFAGAYNVSVTHATGNARKATSTSPASTPMSCPTA